MFQAWSSPLILDNIFLNSSSNANTKSGVLSNYISLLSPIYCIYSIVHLVKPKRLVIKKSYNKDKMNTSQNKLLGEHWSNVLNTTDPINSCKYINTT